MTRGRKVGKLKNSTIKYLAILAVIIGIFSAGYFSGRGYGMPITNSANQQLPEKLDYSEVDEVYKVLRQNFDGELTLDQVMNGLKKGLAGAAGDPYTEYFSPEEAQQFEADLNGSFSGIGAELSLEDQLIVVVAPLSGFPAEKAGVRPGDVIAEVNGEATYGKSLSEVVSEIRGEAGTDVTLTILRENQPQIEVVITRENITIASVESEIKDGIGIMKISRFANDTNSLAAQAALDFKNAGVKGVIIDLRSNPGGYLESAVDVSDLWLEDGKVVVEEKQGEKVVRSHKAKKGATLSGVPTIVLIDAGSASASEIVAGALKDNGVATLLGVKTFGKGSVQTPQSIISGGLLKVTTARWYTPNGVNIDKEGIQPDVEVKFDVEAYQKDKNNDNQLQAAIQRLSN